MGKDGTGDEPVNITSLDVSSLCTPIWPIAEMEPEQWFAMMENYCMMNMAWFEVVINLDGEGETDYSGLRWKISPHPEYPMLECWVV